MLRRILSFLLFFAFISNAWAIDNPVDILNSTVVKTQNELIKNGAEYSKNPYKLLSLINNEIMPVVAPDVIAQLVVGTDKWKKATSKEQQQFVDTAKEMLVFMYAKSVAYAGKYKIKLFPFDKDSNAWQSKSIVIVNGKITNIDNNQGSDFAVKMFQKNGQWHIYDFDVAGVSILEAYKAQFVSYTNVTQMTVAAKKIINKIEKKSYPKLLDKDSKVN